MSRLLFPLMLLFAGCTAQMVTTRGDSPYGPINEAPGGHIRYPAEGGDSASRTLREDAYRQMYAQCDGRYRILLEWDEVDGAITRAWLHTSRGEKVITYDGACSADDHGPARSHSAGTSGIVYRNIEFQCEPPAQTPTAT